MTKEIKYEQVLLVGSGEQKILTKKGIYELANEKDLDVVQVGVDADRELSICKIVDYEKELYNKKKAKKQAEKKANSSRQDIKEIRMTTNIGKNDLETKLRNCKKIVDKEKDICKIVFRVKNNRSEKYVREQATKMLKEISKSISEWGDVSDIKSEAYGVSVIVTGRKNK